MKLANKEQQIHNFNEKITILESNMTNLQSSIKELKSKPLQCEDDIKYETVPANRKIQTDTVSTEGSLQLHLSSNIKFQPFKGFSCSDLMFLLSIEMSKF